MNFTISGSKEFVGFTLGGRYLRRRFLVELSDAIFEIRSWYVKVSSTAFMNSVIKVACELMRRS